MLPHDNKHYVTRTGWLRAAVLGANDGIISTAALLMGMISAQSDTRILMLTGLAGLVAGALSMAAGEYVSVSAQADSEKADLERERLHLDMHPDLEQKELAQHYEARGVTPELAHEIAGQMMQHDDLDAHAREELGITDHPPTNPLLAAFSSAVAFALGGSIPLITAMSTAQTAHAMLILLVNVLLTLAALGAITAYLGGSPIKKAVLRTCFWGALAMGITAIIGRFFDVAV